MKSTIKHEEDEDGEIGDFGDEIDDIYDVPLEKAKCFANLNFDPN